MLVPKYYEDIHTLTVGTEPKRSYYIPTSLCQDQSYLTRSETDRFLLLNDEWKFRYFNSLYECQEAFFEEGYDVTDFDSIPVPSNWQDYGYDIHQYTNTRYPFPFDPPYVPHENPCGAYVCDFDYEMPEGTSTYHLNFEGVDSCYYVWVNGQFMGYHQVSHSTGEFDITSALRNGQNRLAVLVLKWCDGSYLEDQDKFRTSGIFRDVYILARPENYIQDYFVHTSLSDHYTKADITVDLTFAKDVIPVHYEIADASGLVIASDDTSDGQICISLTDIKLWSAEDPYLYSLVMTTADEKICEAVGLREITIRDSVVYLNGSKVRFRGTNRHDSDPFVGSAVTMDDVIIDMALMKQHNFNAIRTSHYPNAPEFYQLCDQFGFYVIDESDVEIHGVCDLFDVNIWQDGYAMPFPPFLCDNPEWAPAIVDRVQKNVMRDKNRPSVVIWSMGNEAGYGCGFEDALAWTKAYDPSRLTHYEGSMHRPRNPIRGKNNYDNIDLRSRMYASIPEMHQYLGNNPDKPFIQCEFIHAMGNGPGDIEDYYALEEQYDTFVGGFVWEWCDHGVYMGTADNGMHKFYYGGDSGEYPHDSNFCMDGLVKPDRTPSTGLKEYKNVHRPVRVHLADAKASTYILQNNLDFTNLKDFLYLTYEILSNGKVVSCGEIKDTQLLDVAPRSRKEVTLPIQAVDGNCSVIIRSKLVSDLPFREAGFELGFDQIMLNDVPTATLKGLLADEDKQFTSSICISEDDHYFYIEGPQFLYTFDRLTGMFAQMTYRNHAFLNRPMEMNIWRAPTDNDRVVKRRWYDAGYDCITTRTYETAISIDDAGQVIIRVKAGMAPVYRQKFLDLQITWTVRPDGVIIAAFDVDRDLVMNGTYASYFTHHLKAADPEKQENPWSGDMDAYLPRLGLRMFLPKEMKDASYYGYGPYESYIDKHQASYIGAFSSHVSKMYESYIRPQENGSHFNCEYVRVADSRYSMTVYNESPFSFNLSEYTQEELTKKAHDYELEKADSTVFCIDYRQSGIGSGSCGPQLDYKYRLNADHYSYSFHIKPEVL